MPAMDFDSLFTRIFNGLEQYKSIPLKWDPSTKKLFLLDKSTTQKQQRAHPRYILIVLFILMQMFIRVVLRKRKNYKINLIIILYKGKNSLRVGVLW